MSRTNEKKQGQDYFNIIEMSKGFRDWDKNKGAMDTDQAIGVWQARAQMAIAQQLSVISGHLKGIVKAARDLPVSTQEQLDPIPDHDDVSEDE